MAPQSAPPELAILVGLPGAGKSTLYRERLAPTHAHVSKDLMKGKGDASRRQERLVEDSLAAGRSVAVDNTNPRRADRAALIAIARRHGARVVAYALVAPARECVARNALREGAARVPRVAIFATARRMEWPSPDEGWDAVYRVETTTPAGFVVTESDGAAI